MSRPKAVVPLSRAEVPLEEGFKTAKCQAEVPVQVPLGYRFAVGIERYLTGTKGGSTASHTKIGNIGPNGRPQAVVPLGQAEVPLKGKNDLNGQIFSGLYKGGVLPH